MRLDVRPGSETSILIAASLYIVALVASATAMGDAPPPDAHQPPLAPPGRLMPQA